MTASWPEQRRGGLVATALARAEGWLLEPAAPAPRVVAERPAPPRPVVAVVGLGRRCGTTTVARGLAVELARRDPAGAALVSAGSLPGGSALATGGARRLARALGGRPVGRLALVAAEDPALRQLAVDRPAPLVLDVGHGTPPEGALALADRAVLVASPEVEPALAGVAARALARDGVAPLVVLNRALEVAEWSEPAAAVVGESRLGARLALAGRDPVGPLRAALETIADGCLEVVAGA
ncbi:MAG: hypothetical protein QOG63_3068 [Thermoleophilaceae bacterium]|nr:hypothetical protein [Thermoleophilaceae bacterium]